MAKHLVFNPSHGSSSVLPRGESVGRGLGGQAEGRTQATASQEPASRAWPSALRHTPLSWMRSDLTFA